MILQIDDNYRITSDEYNFILQEEGRSKEESQKRGKIQKLRVAEISQDPTA